MGITIDKEVVVKLDMFYRFSGGTCDYTGDPSSKAAKALLGGKGAGLVLMAQQGLNVPPGFTIPTTFCNEFRKLKTNTDQTAFLDAVTAEAEQHMNWLSMEFGYTPLVSVRSGAPVSMPGMMDTILNVGLTDVNAEDWAARIGKRATSDSFRRLIQMLGATAYGVPMEVFEFQLAKVKKECGKTSDTDLTDNELGLTCLRYLAAFKQNKGFEFPVGDWKEQLRAAIWAVFHSWDNPRAIEYRKINKLDDAMGTAVNVQAMVFGNMGDDSGSGVLFTRDPSTGAKYIMGEYLANAQGEDVVAGIRTPKSLKTISEEADAANAEPPDWFGALAEVCGHLEGLYRDMVDVEFTVQKGKLFILQSRAGKRSARAAFKIADDLVNEGVITKAEALKRVTREQFKVVRRPSIDPSFKVKPNVVGLPACPGVVCGRPVFSSEEAVNAPDDVILVTHETNPNDIAGMAKAKGILTQTGGATSHAAVVARAMDKPCVVGCTELDIEKLLLIGNSKAGVITIDGGTGQVWIGVEVPVVDASQDASVAAFGLWALQDVKDLVEARPASRAGEGVASELRPVCYDLHEVWGQTIKLKATLKALADLPSRENIYLNIAGPREHTPNVDLALLDCFGDGYYQTSGYKETVVKALITNKEKLEGLAIVNAGDHTDVLVDNEYAVVTEIDPFPVPLDYAVFQALS
jgi:pyruvate,phosphate dikinase